VGQDIGQLDLWRMTTGWKQIDEFKMEGPQHAKECKKHIIKLMMMMLMIYTE